MRRIAADRTGALFALTRGNVLIVFDDRLRLRAGISAPSPATPLGAAYSPVADELYIAWVSASASIDVYSTATLAKLRDVVPTPGLFIDDQLAIGTLRASRDGQLVFAITTAGVGVYRTGL